MLQAWQLIRQTIDEWQRDEAPRMGASLAYYALFSLAPLLVIVIFIIGFVYKGRPNRWSFYGLAKIK
jgi:membrane protein